MNKKNDKYESVNLAQLAGRFWQLVVNVSGELIDRDNTRVYISNELGVISSEKYKEHIKWSDRSIAEPLLFNFYHGIELSLKALLAAKCHTIENQHKLSKLFESVKIEYDDFRLVNFYSKYIMKDNLHPILLRFCNGSDTTMDLFYQSLKYPSDTKGNPFKHTELHYNGKEGVKLFEDIKSDISEFIDVLEDLVNNELNHNNMDGC